MAFRVPARGQRRWSFLDVVARIVSVSTLGAILIVALTHNAIGPLPDVQTVPSTQYVMASISRDGVDPVITGSVQGLFQSEEFVGPNRALKVDRPVPQIDINAFALKFNQARIRIAARNAGPVDPSLQQSVIGAQPDFIQGDESPRISVASIDPGQASAALLAIESMSVLDPNVPVPTALPETLAYARANTPSTERDANPFSDRERWCMATAIYFEARGESYRGQVAVAQVVMNRVKHPAYPNTICGVVFQNSTWRNRCQFSFACDGKPERVTDQTSWKTAEEITDEVTSGALYLPEVSNATHYHAAYVYPHWASRMVRVTRIGLHIFYRFRT